MVVVHVAPILVGDDCDTGSEVDRRKSCGWGQAEERRRLREGVRRR